MPVGFLAAISKGQEGAELTEMGELADAGAVGFTDDGRPVVATSLMRRALQYASITGRPIAVHCEEPTLSRGGHMHEGVVSAELGFGGWPSIAESVMVERDLALARTRAGRCTCCTSPPATRSRRFAAHTRTESARPPR